MAHVLWFCSLSPEVCLLLMWRHFLTWHVAVDLGEHQLCQYYQSVFQHLNLGRSFLYLQLFRHCWVWSWAISIQWSAIDTDFMLLIHPFNNSVVQCYARQLPGCYILLVSQLWIVEHAGHGGCVLVYCGQWEEVWTIGREGRKRRKIGRIVIKLWSYISNVIFTQYRKAPISNHYEISRELF